MLKNIFLVLILSSYCFLSFSQIPDGYYNSCVGKKRAELKTSLHLKIKSATVLNYGGGDGKTWSGFAKTDVRPTDGKVWDMYSDSLRSFNGTLAVSNMNIEHSFPKSWWGGTETQAYKDLHHLNPSDATANQRKSSYMMAVIDSIQTYSNSVIKVGKTKKKEGMLLPAWEPADLYKGDFARAYMYMVTAYEDYAPLWTGDSENQLDNNTYPVFENWTTDLLLEWIKKDPVSQKEINRNNEVFKIQGNRNPFIDFPEMAEYVWGNKSTIPFTLNGVVDYPFLNYPNNNDSVKIGNVYFQKSANFILPIKGMNIKSNINFTISGTNSSSFLLDKSTISQTEAQTGTNLLIQFIAQNVGFQNALLTISGGGIQTIEVKLNALVIDEFVALPATYVTYNGFTANWTRDKNASSYLLDVFTLKPNGQINYSTILEESFNLPLPNNWTKEGWTDNSLAGNIKLGSGNTYGKLTLPTLDLSNNSAVLTIRAKQYSNDTGAKLTVNLNSQFLSELTTSANYQDFKVEIPKSTSISSIALSTIVGKRVYIDNLRLEKVINLQTTQSVLDFPKLVSNFISYSVSGLKPDSTYYYTIKPNVSGTPVSAQIKVRTEMSSNQIVNNLQNIKWIKTPKGITIYNPKKNCSYAIYDVKGKTINTFKNVMSDSFDIKIPRKGIYFIQIKQKDKTTSLKINY